MSVGLTSVQAEELNYNLVQLDYSAEKEVDNDVMEVRLEASSEADSAANAAARVNEEMIWALAQVEGLQKIKKETANYQTYPKYTKYTSNAISSWRVSQELHLESSDIGKLTTVIGTLQKKLKVQQMRFAVSKTKKKEIIDELLVSALKGFYDKARLITNTVGGDQFKVVSLIVNDGGGQNMVYRGAKMMMAMESSSVGQPAVEEGNSTLSVTISGTVQIIH